MSALDVIDTWGADTASAAVFDRTGIVAHHGPIDQAFALASVSKVLTAIVVHIAVEEGAIGLDDPAGPPGATVRHLLSHASGLAPDGDDADHRVLGPPERRRIYSNIGFEVVADHVATHAGMPFGEYAHAALVDPLGLTGTDLSGSPAHAYTSTAADIVTVVSAVLDGRLLGEASRAAMTQSAFADLVGVLPGFGRQEPNPWGLGVEVRGTKSPHWTGHANSAATWGHFGRAGTFVWWDPEAAADGLGLVVLTDRPFDRWAVDAWPPLADAVLDRHS